MNVYKPHKPTPPQRENTIEYEEQLSEDFKTGTYETEKIFNIPRDLNPRIKTICFETDSCSLYVVWETKEVNENYDQELMWYKRQMKTYNSDLAKWQLEEENRLREKLRDLRKDMEES